MGRLIVYYFVLWVANNQMLKTTSLGDQKVWADMLDQTTIPATWFLFQVNGQVKQTAMKMFKKKMLPFPEPIRKFLWLDIIKNSARKSESKGSKKTKVNSNLNESRLI